jgi:type I restriction enzyme R subunit
MDRNAVAAALNEAIASAQSAPASSEQLDFLNKLTDWLSEKGRIDPSKLWEKPFTDQHPAGVSGIFDQGQSAAIVSTLRTLMASESA